MVNVDLYSAIITKVSNVHHAYYNTTQTSKQTIKVMILHVFRLC